MSINPMINRHSVLSNILSHQIAWTLPALTTGTLYALPIILKKNRVLILLVTMQKKKNPEPKPFLLSPWQLFTVCPDSLST